MKYAFFPGCVSRGGCPELYPSAVKVCERLGIELDEMLNASCTGAGVLQEKNKKLGDTLNARTMAIAEKMGYDTIMVICSTCQGVMSQAKKALDSNATYRDEINSYLAEEELKYTGNVQPKHLLWVLIEDIGLDKIREHIQQPLQGVKLAPFYGCYIVRPTSALGFDENPARQTSLETLIELVGADVVDFSGKTRCCGFPILTINEQASVRMVGNHTGEAKALGADAMVTPCPLCHLNLDGYQPAAAKQRGKSIGLPILHFPQMMGLAMGISAKEMGLQRHVIDTKPVQKMLAETSPTS